MKAKWIAGILLTAITISACDDDTANIGSSLTKDVDHFAIVSDTFDVSTRSILIDSVLSQNSTCYLGRIKDPITGDYITSDYTSQFVQLESMASDLFPIKDNMVSRDLADNIIADSCHLNVYIVSSVGDSLAPMGLKVQEMKIPVAEGQFYYTDFSPEEDELVRTDGIMKQKRICVTRQTTFPTSTFPSTTPTPTKTALHGVTTARTSSTATTIIPNTSRTRLRSPRTFARASTLRVLTVQD